MSSRSRATPLLSLLAAAGTDPAPRRRGARRWLPRRLDTRALHLDVLLTSDDLARFGATPGAGVVHVLDRDDLPARRAALRIAAYLAGQSTRQCGPVRQRPAAAGPRRCSELAEPGRGPGTRRGGRTRCAAWSTAAAACAHPDGTARFVASTMRVFADHVEDHLRGDCRARARRLDPL